MADLILDVEQNYSLTISPLDGKIETSLNTELNKQRPELSNYLSKDNITGNFTVTRLFFHSDKKVSDVYIYDLKRYRGEWKLFVPKAKKRCKPLNKAISIKSDTERYPQPKTTYIAKNILIILESPHKAEYDNYFNQLQPANDSDTGGTGGNFFNYFSIYILPKILIKLKRTKTYRICFVESVPYQSSLYFLHKSPIEGAFENLRNEVWEGLFYLYKNDFIERIESYKPFILVNACTKGTKNNNTNLRKTLKDEINGYITINPNSAIACAYKFRTSHPSGWKNTAIKWDKV